MGALPGMYMVGWTFEDGSLYVERWADRFVVEYREVYGEMPPVGIWRQPFPNERGNSFAYGQYESFMQGDVGPMLVEQHGGVTIVQGFWWREGPEGQEPVILMVPVGN